MQQRPHLRVIRLQRRQATGSITRRVGISGSALKRCQRQQTIAVVGMALQLSLIHISMCIRDRIQPVEFLAIRKVRTMEFRWALIACAGVLVFGTLNGIVVAIIVSMIGLASQTAHPRVSVIGRKRGTDVLRPLSPEHSDDETIKGLLIVRPEGRLFFVNAQYVACLLYTSRCV